MTQAVAARRLLFASVAIAVALGARAQAQGATGPLPPADPHYIEGVWLPSHDGPGRPPGAPPPSPAETPAAVAGTTLVCTPVQRLGGAGGGMSNLWIEGPKEIVMISEEDQDVRKIYLTATHSKTLVPQPNGNSIGHWQGDTLVVDTIGFSGPHAGEHVVEHIRKDGDRLLDTAAITKDGQTTQKTFNSVWRPDYQVWENICEEGYANFKIINGQLDNTGSN